MSKRKRRPSIRQEMAARDGETIKVRACCRLVIVLGVGRLQAKHDDHCPALRPASPKFLTARAAPNRAVVAELNRRGMGPAIAIMVR